MLILDANVPSIIEKLDEVVDAIKEQIAIWVHHDSGWVVNGINRVYLDYARYIPLRGGTYIPLPKELGDRKAISNIKKQQQ